MTHVAGPSPVEPAAASRHVERTTGHDAAVEALVARDFQEPRYRIIGLLAGVA